MNSGFAAASWLVPGRMVLAQGVRQAGGHDPRRRPSRRAQRYRCLRCRRSFSNQTFAPTYWPKCPTLLPALFWRLLGCSGFRQIAREFALAPSTVAG